MTTARVSVCGTTVGQLEQLSEDLDFEFRYDASWREDPDGPLLGQLFEDRRPEPIRTSGLPCWFSHLLPQGPWARHLRRWAGLDDDADDLELLIAVGHELPGGVELAAGSANGQVDAWGAPPPEQPGALRFSLAGARWKMSVHQGERGLAVPVRGKRSQYIAKFHDPGYRDLPRIEQATTTWARLAGLRVHETRLASVDEFVSLPPGLPTGSGQVLLATRFDRTELGPVHFEDFGQVLDRPPIRLDHGTYEEIARVIAVLCPGELEELVRRLVFCVLSGNGDMHLKNMALMYPPPGRRSARLTPAYDLVSTILYNPRDTLILSLGGSHDLHAVDARSFDGLRKLVDSSRLDEWIARSVAAVEHAWEGQASDLGFTLEERAALQSHLDRSALRR